MKAFVPEGQLYGCAGVILGQVVSWLLRSDSP